MFKSIPLILPLTIIPIVMVLFLTQNYYKILESEKLTNRFYMNCKTDFSFKDSSSLFLKANTNPNL